MLMLNKEKQSEEKMYTIKEMNVNINMLIFTDQNSNFHLCDLIIML